MTQIHLELSKIKGSCENEGREGTIECHSIDHDLYHSYDGATGLSAGNKVHYPVNIVKDRDKSSPLLYQALVKGEKLDKAKFTYYRTSPQGGEEAFFVKTLKNATIIDIQSDSSPNGTTEQLSIAYEDISWTYTDGGIAAADSIKGPIKQKK